MQEFHRFTDEELAFLAAIHADPKNDSPRFSYADWLQKNGADFQAELIRLQCHQPNIALAVRDPDNQYKSLSYDFPYDDPTAEDRGDRLITLLRAVYRTPRYALERALPYYADHVRGIPLIQVELRDHGDGALLDEIGLLSRIDLTLRTDRLPETFVLTL